MKMKSQCYCQLNSFYRRVLAALVLISALFTDNLSAIQLSGIYSSACEREVGIIMNVDDSKIKILNLDGKIKEIKRFDIIYIAHYPIGNIKVPKIEPSDDMKITQIKTLYKNKVVDLVDGWMTNYSEDKISFLTTAGIETVIDINDVWDIDFKEQNGTIIFNGEESAQKYHFVHPYPFASCNKENLNELTINPQHLLETPLLIKNELDRLQHGYEELKKYVREKIFYPKPQIYTNITTLGIWSSANLRHASSSSRNSNYIPAVRNELSDGLYKFQRVIVTGADTMPFSVHEEPQTQFYYAMKASYFHMYFMYDLNRFITSAYKWQKKDLHNFDNRENDLMHVGGGFDLGNFSVEFAIVNTKYAVRHDDLSHQSGLTFAKLGFFYTHRLIKASAYFMYKPAADVEFKADETQYDLMLYRFYRLNLDLPSYNDFKVSYSMIYKTMDFDKEDNPEGLNGFMYESEGFTNAIYINYNFKEEDLFVKSFISMERLKNRSGLDAYTHEHAYNYFKAGIGVGLVF